MSKAAIYKAWLVGYVDGSMEPPAICEAGIFPDNRPTKAERHNGKGQLVLLQTEGATYQDASDSIKRIICGPEWRWIYRVPVLTSGFLHRWQTGDPGRRACVVCGLAEDAPARRATGDPDRCLVSHVDTCSSCGLRKPIIQGDALCAMCRFPPP